MMAFNRYLFLSLIINSYSRVVRSQCGENCGMYGGFASIATLTFNLDNCALRDSVLKLDCPGKPTWGSLWQMTEFSDEDGVCSYKKPTIVIKTEHACENHISWDIQWRPETNCGGDYSWLRNEFRAFPTAGCNPYLSACSFTTFKEEVRTSGGLEDTKVLCNSGDYFILLSKASTINSKDDNGEYTLIFKTTLENNRLSSSMFPRQEGKYCTAMWEVVKYLRLDLQSDGFYEKLPSACEGGRGQFSLSTGSKVTVTEAVCVALAFFLVALW